MRTQQSKVAARTRVAEQGMTLVEVMVTMGIASVMMMAVIELVTMSQKSARNVTTTVDWNNLTSTVRLALSDQVSCEKVIRYSIQAPGNTYTGGTLVVNTLAYDAVNKVVVTTGSPAGTKGYPNFTVDPLQITPTPGNPSALGNPVLLADNTVNPPVNKWYTSYSVQVVLTGKKTATAGNAGLGSNVMRSSSPLTFNLITGPWANEDLSPPSGPNTKDTIYSCYGNTNTLDAACTALGGTPHHPTAGQPIPDGDTQCTIYQAQYFGGPQGGGNPDPMTALGPPGKTPLYGEKIQLQAAPGGGAGNAQAADYAIGIGDREFWFNLGGSGPSHFDPYVPQQVFNQFVWWGHGDLGNDGPLLALDANANLILNPANVLSPGGAFTTPRANLVFGGNIDVTKPPTEFISSDRKGLYNAVSAPTAQDLEFFTGNSNSPRMSIDHAGVTSINSDDFGESRLVLGAVGSRSSYFRTQTQDIGQANLNGMEFHVGVPSKFTGNNTRLNILNDKDPNNTYTGTVQILPRNDAEEYSSIVFATTAGTTPGWQAGSGEEIRSARNLVPTDPKAWDLEFLQGYELRMMMTSGPSQNPQQTGRVEFMANTTSGFASPSVIFWGSTKSVSDVYIQNINGIALNNNGAVGNVPYACHTVHDSVCPSLPVVEYVYAGGATCDFYAGGDNNIIESRPTDDRRGWKVFCNSATNGSPAGGDFTIICCREHE